MEVRILDLCVAGLALYVVGRLVRKQSAPLPPGPPGWPLIGNLLDFPKHAPYRAFKAASKRYGPVMYFNVMGTRYVVLNSLEASKAVLENKSAITANRPHWTMGGDLVGWNDFMGMLQYGDTYRKQRKFFHQQIGTKSSLEVFHPAQEMEAEQFLRNVLGNPDNLQAHCRRTASSIMLRISHGYSIEEERDPLVQMADKSMHILSMIMTPGRFLVDTFPILRYLPEWFPGGGFHSDARRWRKTVRETLDTPHELVLEHLAKGDALPSLTSRQLQEGVTPEEEEILKWVSFAMYIGGSDTTSITLTAFFLAMAMYPENFKKAQAEVDSVIGNKRLPTLKDRDTLPYVDAICKELLRWNVVVTMVSHVSTQDIIYEGLLIPQGTILLSNMWSILSDPETYPNPDVFDPERFLGENQQLDPRGVCFGWGRRMCPGTLLAESTVFICAAMALATLDISRCVENGVELVPKHDLEEGMIRRVKPFKCAIRPRLVKAEELLCA